MAEKLYKAKTEKYELPSVGRDGGGPRPAAAAATLRPGSGCGRKHDKDGERGPGGGFRHEGGGIRRGKNGHGHRKGGSVGGAVHRQL